MNLASCRNLIISTDSADEPEKVGIPAAAKQLGHHESQLYSWRSKARLGQERSVVEDQLRVENAKLKRQLAEQAEELAIVKKAATYFAKSLK